MRSSMPYRARWRKCRPRSEVKVQASQEQQGKNVRQDRSHHTLRRPASAQFDREGDGRGHASHLLFADPQFQPRLFAGDLRHARPPDRAGRPSAGPCRRAAMGDDRGRGALQGRQAGRRHPAQRSLSWRQPSARSHRLRAGVRRRQAAALDHRPRPSERYRRRHPWRLQSRRHRNLAGRPAHSADQALRGRAAARGPARDAGAERAQPARVSRRPCRDAGRGASRRAARRKTVQRVRRAGRRSRDRGDPGCDRAADPRRGLDLEGRRLPRRGVSRR